MDPGAIASLMQHPIDSALLVLDRDGMPLAANPAAQALGLHAAARYAPLLQDLRQILADETLPTVACSLPGPQRRLDGWMRAVRAPEGGVLAYTLGIPDPEGASRWQVALDGAGHGLWDWDIAANRIFRSESWLAMLGYTADEAPDVSWNRPWCWSIPTTSSACAATCTSTWTGRPTSMSASTACAIATAAGAGSATAAGWWAWSADGRPLRMVGTHTAIEEQKQLESELRRQQALLEEIQRIAAMVPWSWDPRSDEGWWPADLYRLTGHAYRPRDSARAWLRRLPRPAVVALLRAAWRRMRRDGQPARFDLELRDPHGAPLQLLAWARPEMDADGHIVRVLGKVWDVTAQRRADALLRWRTELLDRVSSLGHIGGCEIEPLSRRVQWTEECCRLHGLPSGPLSLDDALALYTRDSRQAFEAALARLAAGGPSERLELCFYRSSGQRVWVQVLIEMDSRPGWPPAPGGPVPRHHPRARDQRADRTALAL